ncbi:MAG: sodium:proton antiporter [Alistipes sp.]|nr:sodium:proton antiporter [Alistipes sp.]
MQQIETWMLIPFCIMLLTIAVAPLLAKRLWESNINKLIFTLIVAVPTAIMLCHYGLGAALTEQLLFDYVPFIILLGTLFVVTGGIRLNYNTIATPWINTIMIFIGYGLASFIGTTGAAMLLIRPLLEINRSRIHKAHTILFFIASVANCGGILSPLGDPPLFLLYLRGAPFNWFATMHDEWLMIGTVLLGLYFVIDMYIFKHKEIIGVRRSEADEDDAPLTISIKGTNNAFLLGAIILCVAIVNPGNIPAIGHEDAPLYMRFLREILLLLIAWISLATTRKSIRKENHFSWEPITEVAILFVGIFTTMTPALTFLNENATQFGISTPAQFFYSAGVLSSILDNAPTAVAFHSVAKALPMAGDIIIAGVPETLLTAIALGAVLFGAMTYIGNGPNFMVKAIAEQEGVQMPSFFGYIFKFSLPVLLPLYILVQILFL